MNIRGVAYTGSHRKATTERIVEAKNATTIHNTIFLSLLKNFFNFQSSLFTNEALVSLSFSIVNHLLRGIHVNLNTTIQLATVFSRVVGNGIL